MSDRAEKRVIWVFIFFAGVGFAIFGASSPGGNAASWRAFALIPGFLIMGYSFYRVRQLGRRRSRTERPDPD